MLEIHLDHPTDAKLLGLPGDEPLGEAGLNRLRWRCRRGLLENDLIIEKFFNSHGRELTVANARALYEIMRLTDNDLLDILLNRVNTPIEALILNIKVLDFRAKPERPEILEVLALLKSCGNRPEVMRVS